MNNSEAVYPLAWEGFKRCVLVYARKSYTYSVTWLCSWGETVTTVAKYEALITAYYEATRAWWFGRMAMEYAKENATIFLRDLPGCDMKHLKHWLISVRHF
jgi:hypothetical protein